MWYKVWLFLKHPVYREEDFSFSQKIKAFSILLMLIVACSIVLGILIEIITTALHLEFGEHAVVALMDTYSPLILFGLIVIAAPIIEELIFRAPLGFFKKSNYFKYVYYASVLLFGLVHITNFNAIENHFWVIPLLVSPQLSAGIFLGYIRTKLGLVWSIFLHAAHNMVLLAPFLIMKLLDIPLE